jgi:hypothetical protein
LSIKDWLATISESELVRWDQLLEAGQSEAQAQRIIIEEFLRPLIAGSSPRDAFEALGARFDLGRRAPAAGYKLLKEFLPVYRSTLLRSLVQDASSFLADSERGIAGCFCSAGVEIWNAYEYAPWEFRNTTVVMGDLVFPDKHSSAEILDGGQLYVAGDVRAWDLFVVSGELHCAGTVQALNRLVVEEEGILTSHGVDAQQFGEFGTVIADSIVAKRRNLASPVRRPTNAEIIAASTRSRR